MNWRMVLASGLLIPFLVAFLLLQVATSSFEKLGLSAGGALLLYMGSLLGGWINIPVWRREIQLDPVAAGSPWAIMNRGGRGGLSFPSRWFYYEPPPVAEQIIAVNLGGAVIPLTMCLYLLPRVPVVSTLLATAGVVAV